MDGGRERESARAREREREREAEREIDRRLVDSSGSVNFGGDRSIPHGQVQEYLAHKKLPPPRTLQ